MAATNDKTSAPEKKTEDARFQINEEVDGVILPQKRRGHVTPMAAHVQHLRKMTLRPDDVLMCSFPKAGSHWLWEVCSMLRQGKSVYENRPKIQLMIDFVDVEEIDEQPSPRTLNTHLPFSMLPVQEIKDKRTKIVHVYRNPKAVVVSMYFMAKTAGFAIADLKFGDFVDYFLSSQAPYGGYFGFLQQMNEFTQNNPDVPVLNVSYEGMIKDPVTNIRQLAKFLEVDVSDKLCEEIAEACSFQNMKNNFIEKSPARFGGGHVGDFQGGPGGEKTPTTDKAEKNKQAAVIFRKEFLVRMREREREAGRQAGRRTDGRTETERRKQTEHYGILVFQARQTTGRTT